MRIKIHQLYNKRGDVPTTILVIGIFAVCILTLLSFYLFGIKENNSFKTALLVNEISRISDEIKFYNLVGKDPLSLSGNSPVILENKFYITKVQNQNEYTIQGSINGTKYLFFEGDKIFDVEYTFRP